jgi:L-alanine-DL-glutamate epimerase-like enolase superfamily enzyme
MVARFGVELVEQPLPVGDAEALTQLVKEDLPPVIADENCLRPDDVLRCRGLFDGINIKLCKCGGIRPALEMIHSARSAGLKIMLGCMVETSVGIAAAAQLAPLVDYVDLDGHLLLADDPFQGIGGAGGRLTLSDRPGLGVVERIET